jgi:hypothetical protein
MPSVEKDYHAAWRDYRRREFTMFASIVACFPGGLLTGLALTPQFGGNAPIFVAMVLTVVVALPCSLWVLRWHCPRCGNFFHRDPALGWRSATQCCTCGLPLYEPRPVP